MGPCLFLPEHLFCLSHYKIRWTLLVDNVGLKICLLGDLELQSRFDIFPLVQTEVDSGRVQQPITYFTKPWDDFMIHDVVNPLVSKEVFGHTRSIS